MMRTGNEVVHRAASALPFMRVIVNGKGSSSELCRSSFVLHTHPHHQCASQPPAFGDG